MSKIQLQPLDARTFKGTLASSFRETIELWRSSGDFRRGFSETLREAPFEAFYWEARPVDRRSLDRPFEFVIVDAPPLAGVQAELAPFGSHFASRPDEAVLRFPNLGGDGILVVPAPVADQSCYTHLARFLRSAPESQTDLFWQVTGEAMQDRISDAPVWLSTAGLGVSWLHLRLDSRPKYYRYQPYKSVVG